MSAIPSWARAPALVRPAVLELGWLLLPIATAAAMAAAEPGRGEGAYLALLAGLVLLPGVRLLAKARASLSLALPVLLVTLSWSLPVGPSRGAAVTLLLVLALAVGVVTRARRGQLDFEALVLTALALQFLLHAGQLLDPPTGVRGLSNWVLLPVAAAGATASLMERFGAARALIAAASLLVLAGGITPMAAATLVVLAAAGRWPLLAAAVAGICMIWDPARGLMLGVGALVLLGGRLWAAAALVAAAALMLLGEPRPWSGVVEELVWMPLLVPLLLPQLAGQGAPGLGHGFGALLLAPVALRILPAEEALMVPLALAALVPAPQFGGQRAPGLTRIALAWSGGLLAAVTHLSSYPWLREQPVRTALEWLGLGSGWSSAAVVVAVAAALALLPSGRRTAPLVAAVLLLLAWQAAASWRSQLLVRWPPVTLSEEHEVWEHESLAGPVGALVLDTSLANAAELRLGTEVAQVRLYSPAGRLREWELRVGYETAEWAAARSDLDPLPVPPPFLHEVAGDGTFFSRRYRARLLSHRPLAASRIEIVRSPALPESVTLTIYTLLRQPRGPR